MHYPSILNLDEGDLSAIKDWKVGKKYKVELVIKQVSSSIGESGMMPGNDSDKNKVHARFEVISAKTDNGKDETYDDEAVKTAIKTKVRP